MSVNLDVKITGTESVTTMSGYSLRIHVADWMRVGVGGEMVLSHLPLL